MLYFFLSGKIHEGGNLLFNLKKIVEHDPDHWNVKNFTDERGP